MDVNTENPTEAESLGRLPAQRTEQCLDGCALVADPGFFSEVFKPLHDPEVCGPEAKVWTLLPYPYIGLVAEHLWGPFAKYLEDFVCPPAIEVCDGKSDSIESVGLDDAAFADDGPFDRVAIRAAIATRAKELIDELAYAV